jgi:UDP-glucose 4-epimerase
MDRRHGDPRGAAARVLVTGGAGFIGANLVRMLRARGDAVTVLDDFSVGQRAHVSGLGVEVVEGDIRETPLVAQLAEGHDAIVHLAAQTGVPISLEAPRRDCEVNVLGSLSVLEAVRAAEAKTPRGRRFIFASSNAPLGRQQPPATEDKAPLPISPYGASKLAGEAYCLAYHGSWGLGTVALRFGNVYGPFSGRKQSVVAKFFGEIDAGRPLVVDGDGGQTRDFIYVEDLCRAVLAALDADVAGEVFQIATGVETSIGELAALVQAVVGRDVVVSAGPPRTGDVRQSYAVVAKAHAQLGWQPQVTLEAGLRKTWQWWNASMRAPALTSL